MRAWLLLLGASTLCVSCDRICGDGDSPTNVAGSWELTGEGECVNQEGERTKLRIDTNRSIPVRQTGTSLRLAKPIEIDGGMFDFTGRVDGACIDFTISETGPDRLTYDFKGVVDGSRIEGSVTGDGDAICRFEGDFDVSVFGSSMPRDIPTTTTSTTVPRECFRTEDCERGFCTSGQCVIVCDSSAECGTGEGCTKGRCEKSEGCNCRATGPEADLGVGLWALLMVWAFRRRRTQVAAKP